MARCGPANSGATMTDKIKVDFIGFAAHVGIALIVLAALVRVAWEILPWTK